jgi:hypothetical protein
LHMHMHSVLLICNIHAAWHDIRFELGVAIMP